MRPSPPNQGSSANGATACLSRTSPRTIMAPPKKDAAMGLYLDSRSLIMATPATPRTHIEISSMSNVTTSTSSVTPMLPPIRTMRAPRVEIRPDLSMLTRMKVSAVEFWVTVPASAPHENPLSPCSVQR